MYPVAADNAVSIHFFSLPRRHSNGDPSTLLVVPDVTYFDTKVHLHSDAKGVLIHHTDKLRSGQQVVWLSTYLLQVLSDYPAPRGVVDIDFLGCHHPRAKGFVNGAIAPSIHDACCIGLETDTVS